MHIQQLTPHWDTRLVVQEKENGAVKKEVEFRVVAQAIKQSSYWAGFLRHMGTKTQPCGNMVHVEDTGISVKAVEIALRSLHYRHHLEKARNSQKEGKEQDEAKDEQKTDEDKQANDWEDLGDASDQQENDDDEMYRELSMFFPAEAFKVDANDVWCVLALVTFEVPDVTDKVKMSARRWERPRHRLGDTKRIRHLGKFLMDANIVLQWFLKWRKTILPSYNTQDDFEKVLFPLFAFGDEVGWKRATKWLCRNTSTGRIAEFSPFVYGIKTRVSAGYYDHLHLPKAVINEVRVTRSQLRHEMNDVIWSIVRGSYGFLSSISCTCRVVATYNYLTALEDGQVLNPELNRNKTVNQIIHDLQAIKYQEPVRACLHCCEAMIQANLQVAQFIGRTFRGMDLKCSKYHKRKESDLLNIRLSKYALIEQSNAKKGL